MSISSLRPVDSGIQWTGRVLFKTGSFKKWLCVWFCSWLAGLSGGGGCRFNVPVGGLENTMQPGAGPVGPGGEPDFEWIRGWIGEHMSTIVAVALAAGLLILALMVLFKWLSSRAHFMFIHNVAANRGDIIAPWRAYRRQGNSLFLFRIVYGIAILLLLAALVAGTAALLVPYLQDPDLIEDNLERFVWLAFACVTALLIFAAVLWMIDVFLYDFVVPIMYLRGVGVLAAWGEFHRLLKANRWPVTIYLHVKAGLLLVVALIAFGLGMVLCAPDLHDTPAPVRLHEGLLAALSRPVRPRVRRPGRGGSAGPGGGGVG